MIAPLLAQQQLNKRQIAQAQTASIPSPTGGLNGRDAIANMPPTDAVTLDNWFPEEQDVALRNGYTQWATGLPGWVETILPYSGVSGTRKLFAASVSGIYDCTSPGAVGSPVVSGLSNARFQWVNFATAGSTFLYGVNGQDNPVLYKGSTWVQVSQISSPIAITGVDPSTFISVNSFSQRLYFIAKNSTGFWYLPAASVGGAANFFDLGPLLTLGGYLMGMCTWTIDNSAGIQQYAVFVSSEGEVLVYQGYDPTSQSTWGLVAQFRIGRPVGRRFYCKKGSDVILLTVDGAIPLSTALLTDRTSLNIAVTDKIRNLIKSDIAQYFNNFGWEVKLFPDGNKIFINVPVIADSISYQYVMNTITGAWCSFGKLNSPWNATPFEYWEDGFYFGGDTYLAQCDYQNSDNNGTIKGSAKQAFNYFGNRGQNKIFTMMRPVFLANGKLQAAVDLNVDFEDSAPTSTPTYTAQGGSPWNTSPWNTSPWGAGTNVIKDWDTPNAIGFCAAPYIIAIAADMNVNWESTDFVFQPGGVL